MKKTYFEILREKTINSLPGFKRIMEVIEPQFDPYVSAQPLFMLGGISRMLMLERYKSPYRNVLSIKYKG